MTAIEIFLQSNGEVTVKYYKTLTAIGPIGEVAMNVFRALKCSTRAKLYRRRSHTSDAYSRKQYSIEQLCQILDKHGDQLGIKFGWKQDPNVLFGGGDYEDGKPSWVLYVDLPTGQVSFHTRERYKIGPDYLGDWDGVQKASQGRVLQFCDNVMKSTQP